MKVVTCRIPRSAAASMQAVLVHQFPDADGVVCGGAGHVEVGGLVDVLAADRPYRHLQRVVARL
jgi:hypothetical protein